MPRSGQVFCLSHIGRMCPDIMKRYLAEEREKLRFSASGGGIMMLFSALSAFHHKNILHLLPIFPTVSYLGYQVHYCYGNKLAIIDEMAAKLCQGHIEELAPYPIRVQDVRNRMTQLRLLKQDEEIFM
uniref:Transmembrane protein 177 n=1 Tax=Angiostrongylus cantonensis TaxID=6313 RepID=A0A0K0DE03_ANGCA